MTVDNRTTELAERIYERVIENSDGSIFKHGALEKIARGCFQVAVAFYAEEERLDRLAGTETIGTTHMEF